MDACLTRLGNAMEDRMGDQAVPPLGTQQLGTMEDLLLACRQAASLQPDGTRQPLQRCEVRVAVCRAGVAACWGLQINW